MGRLRKKNQQGYLRADIFFMFLLLSILVPLNASTQSPGKIRLNTTPDPDVLEFYTGSNWIPMNASDTAVSCTGFYSKIRLNTTPTPDRVEYCNGTNWISMEAYISNDVCTELGRIELHSSSNSVRYCNGSNWVHTGGAWVTVFITAGSNWTVPDDWDSSQNVIHVIGGGGGSGDPTVGGGSGGGGGAYSRVANLTLTPSATIDIQVGTGGAENSAGTDTFFNGTTCGGSSACAKGGGGASGSDQTVGTGGAAASGVGTTKYSGGDGGSGGTTGNDGAGGGGGAAGPDGDGENGGNANNTARGGGGGGAGGTSSTVGANETGADGGPGGHGPDGTGGGAGGTGGGDGGAGTAGGGGGGGDNGGGNGGAGSMYEAWTQTSDDAKAGPGGGSGGSARNSPGVAGASYGAGAGGPGEDGGDGAAGGPGLIVVQYYSVNGASSGSSGGSYDTEIELTSGTTWTVPNDWNDSDNSIECIGGGGGGGRGGTDFANNPGAGGGGGGYSAVTNVTLTPGATVGLQIGDGGAGATTNSTAGTAGTDSYFCNDTSNCANIGGSAVIVGAKGGGAGGVKTTGGAGGAAASGVGTTKYTGGNGGSTAGGADGGGGGGGAAGPNGDGGSGGDITSSGGGGTGGGGNGGGADAGPNTGDNASMGANNFSGSGGGASAGAAGTNGGGGAGGNDSAIAAPYYGGAGGNGDEWGTSGSGGGGGGGGWVNGGEPGGNGGLYGAGGGGGSPGGNNGGNGANGICVVRYNAASAYDTEVTLTSGTSWTVPNDWNDSNNIIECIGGGGKGQGGQGCGGSDGGGGGGYSAVTNTTLTPGASVTMMIGSAGTTGSVDGGDSYFCNSTSNCASIAGSAVIVGAKGGLGGANGRTGGLAASGIGSTKYSGGTGGAASDCGGAGGGGAAGPLGDGGAGGGTNWDGAGGGGGNGGGSAGGTVVSSTDGGDGGNNNGGSGGGAGGSGSTPGANGTNGGGGGGGTNGGAGNMGGTGGNGTDINGTVGSGGGGGGSGTDGTIGAAAGNYGGGGGGSADNGGVNDGGDGAPGICVVRYQASGSSTGLIGRWPLDDTTGTTVVETVSGNNGTWQDTAVVSVPGKISTGLDFDGTSSNRVHNADDAYDNLTAMTVCAWFKMDSFASQFPDLVAKTNGSGANGWMFYVNDPGNAIGLQTNKDDWAESAGAYYNSEHGTWVHACATWDGSDGIGGINVYKNGSNLTINSSGTGAGDFDDSANNLHIGGSGTSHFDGTIDDVRIYNRVLSAAEIQDIYNGADSDSTADPHIDNVVLLIQPDADDTTAIDYSSSAHSITETGVVVNTGVADPWGGANKVIHFNSNNDFLEMPDSDDWHVSDQDFTIEAWGYFTALNTNTHIHFGTQWDSGGSESFFGFGIYNDTNAGLANLYGEHPSTLFAHSEGTDRVAPSGQWGHFAWVREGNNWLMFVDGQLIHTNSYTDVMQNFDDRWLIGSDEATGGQDFYLGAYRFTKGVARYTANFTPSTSTFPLPPSPATEISCPTGYIPVPADGVYTGQDFCVMKYEAKDVSGTATSQATSTPWVSINRSTAETECTDLGAGYDLMSNHQWQTIARNIENTAWNWDTGVVGGGNGLNHGHADNSPANSLAADADDNNACSGTGNTCDGSTWHVERRTHKLSNGEIIWDLGGNVAEWSSTSLSFSYGADAAISQITETYGNEGPLGYPKHAFGPAGDYTSFNSGDYGGLGQGEISPSSSVVRGGYWNDGNVAGPFATWTGQGPSTSNTLLGFRCVYNPAPVASTSDVTWDKVVLLIQPGTSDTVIDDLSSLDHTFSFNNDAAFSTAISDPFGGSNKVIAMDGTGDYLNSADSDGWHLDGDFTWEFWMNWNSMTTSERATFTWQYQDGSNNGGLWLDNGASNTGLIFTHTGISDLPEGADHTASTGNWHHYALTRSGEDIRLFFNGTELSSTASQVAFANLAGNFYIGADGGGASSTWSANGYFGPIRFTKGVSHYHGNFIPPTNPFPTAATEPTASVTFDDATGEYMSKTFSNAGNRKTWTMSTWFKRDNNSSDYENFLAGDNGGSGAAVGISPSNHLELWDESQQGGTAVVQTTTTITDTSWHHLVVVLDTTQSTAADRVKIYLDGTRLTAFNINHIANFAQDENGDMNRAAAHYVGRVSWGAAEFFDGKLSEYHFIDGLALDPSHFGYDNNGTWTPKTYGGGYGTNGFYLFGNGFSESAIGTDQSGNGNDLTLTNMDSSNRNADGPP